MSVLKTLSRSLAEEISERRVYNIPEIETMIYVRIKCSMKEILIEQLTMEEREYTRALELQSTLHVGSKDYVKNSLKIGELKRRKSMINRGLSEIRKDDANTSLKQFIRENHGEEVLLEVLNQDKG